MSALKGEEFVEAVHGIVRSHQAPHYLPIAIFPTPY